MTMSDVKDTNLDLSKVNRSELARAVGVDLAHISRIFSGKSFPSFKLAVKIASHLEISTDVLFAYLNSLVEPSGEIGE